MISLFPLQETLIGQVRSAMRQYKRILTVAPTGFGKSICMLFMIASAYAKGKRVWIVVPRIELLLQMSNILKDLGIPFSYIAAGCEYNAIARIHLCSSQTLIKRLDRLTPPDLAMIDETHFGGDGLNTLIG